MENLSEQLNAILIVTIAGLLAVVPGLDRERRQRPAGLRTHMLVGMSCALITAMSRIVYSDDSEARMTANILTGIGFLGAGVILRRKNIIHDVTTAASVWMMAMIGIVVGYELYVLAVGSTLLFSFVLTIVRQMEDKEVLHPAEKAANAQKNGQPPPVNLEADK
jgi:putative Mg2+ transporter-C (MgtC) family protein